MTAVISSPLLKTYTLEEFWQLPEPVDRSKLELIAGVLYMTPPAEGPHARVVKRLNRLLSEHLTVESAVFPDLILPVEKLFED